MVKKRYIMFPGAFYHSDIWESVSGDYVKAYIDLCFRSTYKECDYDCMYGKVHLMKGEMVTSYRDLSSRWKFPKAKVERIIKYLTDRGLISMRTAGQETGHKTGHHLGRYSILKVNELDGIAGHFTGHLEGRQEGQDNKENNNSNNLSNDKYIYKEAPNDKFSIPTPEEVQRYLLELHEFRMTGSQFCDYYDSIGWTIGRNKPMKSWKACVKTWISNMNRGLFINRDNGRYISKEELRKQQHEESMKLITDELTHKDREQDKLPF